jgi:DNA-binding TFAR19-related protein (PDSD5 family)
VKPEKAERLEQIIIANAQRGQFQGKVSEAQLIDLLN